MDTLFIDIKTTGFNVDADAVTHIGLLTWDLDKPVSTCKIVEHTLVDRSVADIGDEFTQYTSKSLIIPPQAAADHLDRLYGSASQITVDQLRGILERCYSIHSVVYGCSIYNHEMPFLNKVLKYTGNIVDVGLLVKAIKAGVAISDISTCTWADLYFNYNNITYGVDTVCVPDLDLRAKWDGKIHKILEANGIHPPSRRFWQHTCARSSGQQVLIDACIYSEVVDGEDRT